MQWHQHTMFVAMMNYLLMYLAISPPLPHMSPKMVRTDYSPTMLIPHSLFTLPSLLFSIFSLFLFLLLSLSHCLANILFHDPGVCSNCLCKYLFQYFLQLTYENTTEFYYNIKCTLSMVFICWSIYSDSVT